MRSVLISAAVVHVLASVDTHALCDERFLFHQMLAGKDVAVPERAINAKQRKLFSMANSMQNFMYLVGDRQTGECVAIDACYDPEGVVAVAKAAGCNITAAIGTHFHYDHIGHAGRVPMGPGLVLPGLGHFVAQSIPAYIHAIERETAAMQIGVDAAAIDIVMPPATPNTSPVFFPHETMPRAGSKTDKQPERIGTLTPAP